MYKRLSAILFPIAAVLLFGTAFWGYQEHQEKNSVLIKAENQYQRAFHDLSFHMDKLNTELGNALIVSNGADWHRKCLLNVWRITSQAQTEVNQLPLSLMPFNKTQEFLSKISNFSYQTAIRDLTKQPMNADEKKTLSSLFESSKQMNGELQNVQKSVLVKNLRWMDVETALAMEREPRDSTIVDGFKTVDKQVKEYSEVNWGPSMSSLYQKRSLTALGGPDTGPDQIKQKAAAFLGVRDTSQIRVVENGAGTEFASYSVQYGKGRGNDGIQMGFSKKGGQLLWMMNERPVREKRLTIDQAAQAAEHFLTNHGYKNIEPVSYDQYENMTSITFAGVQNGVIIMPERIVAKVALDNGDVTGLHAADYVFEHKPRQLPAPKVTADEARKSLDGSIQVTEESLALIENDLKEQVLCHQFTGNMKGAGYRVYINAQTGIQEKIEPIRQSNPREVDSGKPRA